MADTDHQPQLLKFSGAAMSLALYPSIESSLLEKITYSSLYIVVKAIRMVFLFGIVKLSLSNL
jgi:hypothetical protein